jgi:hypothetical protein
MRIRVTNPGGLHADQHIVRREQWNLDFLLLKRRPNCGETDSFHADDGIVAQASRLWDKERRFETAVLWFGDFKSPLLVLPAGCFLLTIAQR